MFKEIQLRQTNIASQAEPKPKTQQATPLGEKFNGFLGEINVRVSVRLRVFWLL